MMETAQQATRRAAEEAARLEIHRTRLQFEDLSQYGAWSGLRVKALLEAAETIVRHTEAAVRDALNKYGEHLADCKMNSKYDVPCSCGLAELRRTHGGRDERSGLRAPAVPPPPA